MSEQTDNLQQPERGQAAAAGLDRPSFDSHNTPGGMLRHYREQRGVSVAELAAVLKITPDKLEALERDDYSRLPDMVFTRALSLSICRLLEADSKPVMALFPSIDSPRLSRDSDGLNKPFKAGEPSVMTASRGGEGWRIARPAYWIGAALLVAAALVYFWPDLQQQLGLAETETERAAAVDGVGQSTTTQSATALSPLGSAAVGGPFAPQPEPERVAGATGAPQMLQALQVPGLTTGSGENVATQIDAAPAAELADSDAGAGATETSTEPEPEAQAPVAPPPPAETIRILAEDPVWVQIRDGSNAILHQSTLPKGREIAITNAPPLRVEIGRADSVQVTVKGESFDVKPFARGNVARFEVRP